MASSDDAPGRGRRVADVGEQRHAGALGGGAEPGVLVVGDVRGVLGVDGEADEALVELGVEVVLEPGDLRGAGRALDADGVAVPLVGEGAAVVQGRGVGTRVRREELAGVDRGLDPVHAEVGGDAVAELVPDPVGVGLVGEHVDEARGHDLAGGVDGGLAGERVGADEGDALADDADVGDLVVARRGVHDPAAGDDGVEDVVGGRRGLGALERRRVDALGLGDLDGAAALARRAARAGGAEHGHAHEPCAADGEEAPTAHAGRVGGRGELRGGHDPRSYRCPFAPEVTLAAARRAGPGRGSGGGPHPRDRGADLHQNGGRGGEGRRSGASPRSWCRCTASAPRRSRPWRWRSPSRGHRSGRRPWRGRCASTTRNLS